MKTSRNITEKDQFVKHNNFPNQASQHFIHPSTFVQGQHTPCSSKKWLLGRVTCTLRLLINFCAKPSPKHKKKKKRNENRKSQNARLKASGAPIGPQACIFFHNDRCLCSLARTLNTGTCHLPPAIGTS